MAPVDNTLVTVPDDQEAGGELLVHTADQWGPFAVTTRLLDTVPEDPGPDWEDVVELSVTTPAPLIVTEMIDNDPQINLVADPGQYRLRVSARGRRLPDVDGDDEDDERDEDAAPPVEWYLLEAWPAPVTDPVAVRLTSPFALNQLNPPPPLVIPEGEAGLAASVRIGRDVDGKPGARVMSGELGSVHAERTIRGPRRRLFRLCAHLMTWSHQWVGVSSWSFSGWAPDGDEYAPGYEHLGRSHRDADQLTGEHGSVRWTFVDVQQPHRAVRDWEWLYDQVPFLPAPTRITVTLTQSRDDAGDPWTTIAIDHDRLPVEWVEDMETYWNYQLSIADHAGFGVAK